MCKSSQINCVIVGDSDVTKVVYLRKENSGELKSGVSMNLSDSSEKTGYERLNTLTASDLFLLVFSIDNINSFKNLKEIYYPEICFNCPGVPIILIGIAMDPIKIDNSVISPKALEFSQEIQAFKYVECSLTDKNLVNQAFEEVAQSILISHFPQGKDKKNKCSIM